MKTLQTKTQTSAPSTIPMIWFEVDKANQFVPVTGNVMMLSPHKMVFEDSKDRLVLESSYDITKFLMHNIIRMVAVKPSGLGFGKVKRLFPLPNRNFFKAEDGQDKFSPNEGNLLKEQLIQGGSEPMQMYEKYRELNHQVHLLLQNTFNLSEDDMKNGIGSESLLEEGSVNAVQPKSISKPKITVGQQKPAKIMKRKNRKFFQKQAKKFAQI